MITLRAVHPGEVERLLPWMEEFNRAEGIRIDPPRLAAAIHRLLAQESLGAIRWIDDGASARGYVVWTWGYDLEWAGRDAFLTEIWVVPEARGRGVGSAVLGLVEGESRAGGAGALHLMVHPENEPAMAMYAHAGYASPPRVFLTKVL